MNPENVTMPFGKYKGKTLRDILDTDPVYLDWVQDQITKPALREAVEEMCRKYSAEIERAIGD